MSSFVAALPMYDWPEIRAEVDAQWERLREALRATGLDAPEKLARRNGDLPAVPGGVHDGEGRVVAPDPASLPPDELDARAIWLHPRLLLAQTCWGPMEQGLAAHVAVVGQPSYEGMEGGQGEFYSSAILMRWDSPALRGRWPEGPEGGGQGSARRERGAAASRTTPTPDLRSDPSHKGEGKGSRAISPLEGEMSGRTEGGVPAPLDGRPVIPPDLIRGKRLAYNGLDSMSGIIALTRDLEAMGETSAIFSSRLETGSHRASIVAVAEGRADVCAVDCRSWQLARRHEPAAADIQVVGWTARRKGLPFITSRFVSAEQIAKLRDALAG